MTIKVVQNMSSQILPKIDPKAQNSRLLVGLSACLAGDKVRYNGGHCQSSLCLNTLSAHFSFETFCPEAAAGFGTPRPAMRLVGDPQSPRLTYVNDNSANLNSQLHKGYKKPLAGFGKLDGFILMKNSPSCGLERIKVFQNNGHPHERKGKGLFASALLNMYPLLPVEEEGRLHDAQLYENFILRVYAHHNFRHEVMASPVLHSLIAFHSSYKYVLMAHDQDYYRSLGAMLSGNSDLPIGELFERYFVDFMQALSKPANTKNHSNTLFHILGYLKKTVSSAARQHIVEVIEQYRAGQVPLSVPLVLLKHYIEREGSEYIRMQRYLQPYPNELGLANRV
jgi:uncharacterized protein YbgA (DUF1722 family)/uncharacterized protein YbbK (DUF523 family)